MRRTAAVLALLAIPAIAYAKARKPTDKDYEFHFKGEPVLENDVFRMDLKVAHSQVDFAKLDVKMTNKTRDYLLVRNENVVFDTGSGKFQPFGGKPKPPEIIQPDKAGPQSWKVQGETDFKVQNFTVDLSKAIFRANSDGTAIPGPDFQLPAARNDFEAGPFYCELVNAKLTTDATGADFSCTYKGTGVGYIDAGKLGVRIPSGQLFANANTTAKKHVLLPGDKAKILAVFKIEAHIIDMQFATMWVMWNDTFREAYPEPVAVTPWAFAYDEAKTKDQND